MRFKCNSVPFHLFPVPLTSPSLRLCLPAVIRLLHSITTDIKLSRSPDLNRSEPSGYYQPTTPIQVLHILLLSPHPRHKRILEPVGDKVHYPVCLNLEPSVFHTDNHYPNTPTQKTLGTVQPWVNPSDTTKYSLSWRTNSTSLLKRMKSLHKTNCRAIVIKSIPNIIQSMTRISLPKITNLATLFYQLNSLWQDLRLPGYWIGTIHIQL